MVALISFVLEYRVFGGTIIGFMEFSAYFITIEMVYHLIRFLITLDDSCCTSHVLGGIGMSP